MKNLIALLVVMVFFGCASHDKAADSETKGRGSDSLEPLGNSSKNSASASSFFPLKIKKTCPGTQCVSYQVSISEANLLTVDYATKKMSTMSIVLSPSNIEQFNTLMAQFDLSAENQAGSLTQDSCYSEIAEASSYQMFILKNNNSANLSFYMGCKSLTEKYINLARWFDNKAYAAIEN